MPGYCLALATWLRSKIAPRGSRMGARPGLRALVCVVRSGGNLAIGENNPPLSPRVIYHTHPETAGVWHVGGATTQISLGWLSLHGL